MSEAAPHGVGILLTATDADAAAATIADEYTEITVKAPPRRPFAMKLHAFVLPALRYGELSLSVSEVRTQASPNYILCIPTHGKLVATADDSTDVVYATGAAIVSPGSRVDAKYLRDVVIRTVYFDPSVARHELSSLIGRNVEAPPRFDFALRPGPGLRAIERAVALLHDELQAANPLMAEPVFADRLSRVIISGLLLSQPHSYTEELGHRSRVEGPRALRSLLARMEAAPMDFTTVGDLAAAAGLSVRALEEAFRRHVGVSPMTQLRQFRLSKARAELIEANPSEVTTAAIARRWGFAHYGRFASRYREQFGSSPMQDLKKGGNREPR